MSRSLGSRSLTSRSPIWMSPLVIGMRPATRLSVVVLPQPDGPTSATNSPSSIVNDTLLTARTDPYRLTTSSNTTLAIDHPTRLERRVGRRRLSFDRTLGKRFDEIPLQQ